MLIAEIPDVVGKKIHAQTERRHAAKLGVVGHLTMLQRVTVVEAWMACLRFLNRIERSLGGFVAIDMDMHLHALAMQANDLLLEAIGRGVPDAVRMPHQIARPFETAGITLDRTIGHQLHSAEPELVRGAFAEFCRAPRDILGRLGHAVQRRHDAQLKVVACGHGRELGDIFFWQFVQ